MNRKDRFTGLLFALFSLSVIGFIGIYLLVIAIAVSTSVIN